MMILINVVCAVLIVLAVFHEIKAAKKRKAEKAALKAASTAKSKA